MQRIHTFTRLLKFQTCQWYGFFVVVVVFCFFLMSSLFFSPCTAPAQAKMLGFLFDCDYLILITVDIAERNMVVFKCRVLPLTMKVHKPGWHISIFVPQQHTRCWQNVPIPPICCRHSGIIEYVCYGCVPVYWLEKMALAQWTCFAHKLTYNIRTSHAGYAHKHLKYSCTVNVELKFKVQWCYYFKTTSHEKFKPIIPYLIFLVAFQTHNLREHKCYTYLCNPRGSAPRCYRFVCTWIYPTWNTSGVTGHRRAFNKKRGQWVGMTCRYQTVNIYTPDQGFIPV